MYGLVLLLQCNLREIKSIYLLEGEGVLCRAYISAKIFINDWNITIYHGIFLKSDPLEGWWALASTLAFLEYDNMIDSTNNLKNWR